MRWIVRAGAAWCLMPHDLPPCHTVYRQSQCWKAGAFAAMVHDLRKLLWLMQGRNAQPSAVVFDSPHSAIDAGEWQQAGYDSAKRRRGSKMHIATPGHLLAVPITAASELPKPRVVKHSNAWAACFRRLARVDAQALRGIDSLKCITRSELLKATKSASRACYTAWSRLCPLEGMLLDRGRIASPQNHKDGAEPYNTAERCAI